MSSREAILAKVRSSLGVKGNEPDRIAAIQQRMAKPTLGVIPQRGQLEPGPLLKLFKAKLIEAIATAENVKSREDVPKAVAKYLRSKNLPASIRMGSDSRFSRMGWSTLKGFEVKRGPSDGDDEAAVSYAFGGVAETGTLMLQSGAANPTSLNFLPDYHIVVVDAKDVTGDFEALWRKLRKKIGDGDLPRSVNLITGPSRSGDIEQKLILGAHGPRALHVIIVGE
jgi:L-lactate dehydrogenase complex protein LldG